MRREIGNRPGKGYAHHGLGQVATQRARLAPASTRSGLESRRVDLMGAYSNRTYWTERLNGLRTARPETRPERSTPRNVARQLRNDEVEQLVYGYQEGATVYELATRFRIHRLTVSRHLHRAGVAMRGRGLDEQEVDAAVQLHREGWSLARLGDHFGVDKRTARSALRARGCQV
jgi:hypothetical protein